MELGISGKTALVTGASIGIGRGIAMLLASRGAHVVAAARGDNAAATVAEIEHAGGSADLASVEKAIARDGKKAKSGDKDAQKLVAVLEKLLPHLNEGKPLRSFKLDDEEKVLLKPLCLLTIKPAMYVATGIVP